MSVEIKAKYGKSNFASMEDGILKIWWEDYNIEVLGGMDLECNFTIPESEFANIYNRYEIDPKISILEAFQLISDSNRGYQLCSEMADRTIKTSEKHYWLHEG